MLIIALALAMQAPDSYADTATADLVARARAARQRNERLVTSYTADVTQRMGVGLRAFSRDRMIFHQELAAHIEWYRDRPSRVNVIGARQAVPIALPGNQVPEDLDDQARFLVLNPAEDYLRVVGAADSEGFVYPLRRDGERDYRFAAGDTTTISLPSGRTVRVAELRVIPRRADFRLMSGSLWFDLDTYGLVRAVFKPARPFDLRRDADSTDRKDMPSWLNVGAEVKYVTLEYGLYESRWWLPRYMAIDAVGTMGSLLNVPFRYERSYSDYHVEGGTPPAPGSTFRPAGSVGRNRGQLLVKRDSVRDRADSLRALGLDSSTIAADSLLARLMADTTRLRTRFDSVRLARRECLRAERDSLREERRRKGGARIEVRVRRSRCFPADSTLVVVVPSDTLEMIASPALGAPVLDMGDVMDQNELAQLAREIGALPQQPWQFAPHLPTGLVDLLGHLRYNRIEALSIGLGGEMDFGRLRLDGLARIGIADGEPNFELGLTRPTAGGDRYRLGAYRRLAAANPDMDPLGLGNSLSALFMQRDDGSYFRTLGAELTGTAESGWLRWRVYGERQRAAFVGTQASLPRLFSSTSAFDSNIVAQGADQLGASLAVHGAKIVSGALTLGAEAAVEGAGGDYRYGKLALTLRSTLQLGGLPALGLEAAAGTSTGTVPVQGAFELGGPPTLRGYGGGAFIGDAFWRGRAELATRFPAARLALFADAGWAGPRAAFSAGRASWGGGIGASFLDGLFRMDLARAFSAPKGWRFDVYLDAIL